MDDFRPTSSFNNSTQIKLTFNIFWTSNSFTEVIGDIMTCNCLLLFELNGGWLISDTESARNQQIFRCIISMMLEFWSWWWYKFFFRESKIQILCYIWSVISGVLLLMLRSAGLWAQVLPKNVRTSCHRPRFWHFVLLHAKEQITVSSTARTSSALVAACLLHLCMDVPSWWSWTASVTWMECRYHLMLPVVTGTPGKSKTRDKSNRLA